MKRYLLAVVALLGIYAISWTPALATTYYGPSFSMPTAIPPGSTINIVLSTASGSAVVALPQGSSTPCSGTCSYPQQPWTSPSACFVSVHEVTVTDPNGNQFMLGSSTTSGLYWPSAFGGSGSGTSVPPQAPALNYTVGDSFTIPFGTGPEGYTFTSVLGSPYNTNPEGPYYWWVSVVGAGNPNGYTVGARLDQTSINPTMTHGTYTVDVEGVVACPGSQSSTFQNVLFFDAGTIVTTPEFGAGMAAATAVALVGLLVLRKRMPTLVSNPSA
ncbi:MAG: hypothetical protein JRN68_05935 [Nitrososphaerota archaeon]|nr:hypothetical protein [Nitrososphaerota archaeon]